MCIQVINDMIQKWDGNIDLVVVKHCSNLDIAAVMLAFLLYLADTAQFPPSLPSVDPARR